MIYSTFAGAMRTCALIGALLGLMPFSAAAHPVDDPADPVYRARTVLPDAAKARRDAPALETLRAAVPRTVHLADAAALVVSAADAHGKLPALTEVGVHKNGGGLALTGNDDPHWTSAAAAVARRHHIPYLMTWANFEQEEKNFYHPFMVSDTRGHKLVDGFIDYYNEETSLFADGLGDWRGLPVPVQR